MENDGQGGMISSSQESGIDAFASFNEPIKMMEEDSGMIVPNSVILEQQAQDWSEAEKTDNSQHQAGTTSEESTTETETTEDDPFANIFNDDLVDEFAAEKVEKAGLTEEELIAQLKEKGYNINKEETVPEEESQRVEMQRLNAEYDNAIAFINKSDDEKISEKVKSDLTREYASLGQGHLVGGEDFEYEVQQKINKISENEVTKNLYTENLTKGIQAYADGLKNDQQKITDAAVQKEKRETAERRSNLQSSIKTIAATPFMGITVTPEMAAEVYQHVTSGDFTKEVNNNPTLVAEFALFKQNKEAIMANVGGATYGEGVKAGVQSIVNGSAQTSRPSLQNAMASPSNASGSQVTRRQAWQTPVIENTEQTPAAPIQTPGSNYVAGRGNL